MISNLIETCTQKLILNHLTGNNCPGFCNYILDRYFFKLTLGICLKLIFWPVAFKSNITKIPVAFKPELSTQIGAYAAFKFNHKALLILT